MLARVRPHQPLGFPDRFVARMRKRQRIVVSSEKQKQTNSGKKAWSMKGRGNTFAAGLARIQPVRTCFEMRFGVTDELYDGPPSPSKPVGETNSDGFGEPSYGFQDTF